MPRIIGVRCGMKIERHRRLASAVEALHDLRMMPVARHAVGLEVVGGLAEHQLELGLAPGAGHARLGVGDQVREIDDARLDQRQEAELDRGRIAAGIADEARLARSPRG